MTGFAFNTDFLGSKDRQKVPLIIYSIVAIVFTIAPFFTLYSKKKWVNVVSMVFIVSYSFVFFMAFISDHLWSYSVFSFMMMGPFAGIFSLIDRAILGSISGVLTLGCSIVIAVFVFKKLKINKIEPLIKTIVIAFSFYLSMAVLGFIFVNAQLLTTASIQFGDKKCGYHAELPTTMLKYGSTDFPFSHATILTDKGQYNWSFRQNKWTFDIYTGNSSDDEAAIRRMQSHYQKAYAECIARR